MKVEIHIDPGVGEPRLILETAAMTEALEALVERLRSDDREHLTAYSPRGAVFLPLHRVLRIYAERQRIVLCNV